MTDQEHAADTVAVTQLVLQERQGRDRGWWQQMRGCLAADARITLSWFRGTGTDFVTRSEEMVRSGTTSTHRLGPPVVHVSGDRALVEVPATIKARVDIGGLTADLASNTRILYRAERRHGRWWLVALDTIYENDTLTPVIPGTVPAVDADRLAHFREPYQLLAYHLDSLGYEVAEDLYGDDRPQEVERLYDEAFAWLRG